MSFSGTGMMQFIAWVGFIYDVFTKAIIILRVSAMFNHPKRTAYILSFLFVLVIIESLVVDFSWVGPRSRVIVSTSTDVNVTSCQAQSVPNSMDIMYGSLPGPLFDLLLLVLAFYRFAVHSMGTRNISGRTRVNVYMRLLFEHNIIYFFFNFADRGLATAMLFSSSMLYTAFANLYCSSVPYILYPRLVLSLKSHRSQSDGLHVGSDGPPHPSHLASSGERSNGDYELSDINSPTSEKRDSLPEA
ncbi:hypothetical protein BDN67DRAFT_683865 [Paxillus ammoniavirescens]|nr:hypothetical protein BDN67DRAFT_683865 [Paxillus ammoniavirescens]